MKSEDSQPVTVEDFSRRCLQGTKLRLGKVASKWGSRIRRKRRIVGGKKRDAVLEGSGPVKGREAHRRQRIRGAVNRFIARKPDGCRLPVGTSVLTRPAFLVLVVLCMAAAHAQQDKSAAPPIGTTLSDEEFRFRLWTGCQPMGLVVEGLSADAGKIGLTREALQNAAESRLRAARLYDESSYEDLLSINVTVVGPAFDISVNFFKRMLDRRETDRRLSKTWDSILDSILDNWDAALDLPEEERKEYLDALLGIGAVSETEQVRLRLKDLVAWKRDISFFSYAWPPLARVYRVRASIALP